MKFDCIVMNPPYQSPTRRATGGFGSRNALYPQSVLLAIKLTKENGYLAIVHPPKWRKPGDKLYKTLSNLNMLYLEMHSNKEAIKTFKALVMYDWYILQNALYKKQSTVKFSDGVIKKINLTEYPFLPSQNIDLVISLLAKEGEENVLSQNGNNRTKRTKEEREIKTEEFCYRYVNATRKYKVCYHYNNKRDNSFFPKKLIFGCSYAIASSVIDMEGDYGVTQNAIAIHISSQEEGEQMKKALESKAFNDLLKYSLKWSSFRIEQKMFNYFRRDFWKEFV